MAKGENAIGVGAVLAIPLGDGRWTLSQVYWPGVVFFLLVFNNVSDTLPNRPVISGSPILGSWTNDAEVYRGNWRLLTNLPVTAGIFAEPEYSVLISGEPFVESFDGRAFRPRVAGDELLKNRKSRSPLLVEDATRSFFGLQDWAPHYDDMLLAPTA